MNRTSRLLATAAVFAALSAGLVRPAQAYDIQKTSSGKEIKWRYLPQNFYVDSHGYAGIADGTLFDAEKGSFTPWEDVEMSDARYNVKTATKGASDIFSDANKPGRDRFNEMAFVETDWARSGGNATLIALTFTYFADTTGKILENDIVANAQDFDWTDGDVNVKTDVRDFLTHEVGHSYGIGHSDDPSATMFATGTQGETLKRDLALDDIAAIQHLYKPGCCKHTKTGDLLSLVGCDVTSTRGGSPIAWLAGFLLLPAIVLARRSRRGSAALVALAFLGAAGSAHATIALSVSLDELARGADAVVHGRVVWSEAIRNPGGSIVTLTQIEVSSMIAGAPSKVVTLVQPGGVPKDGIDEAMRVEGTASFAIGDEVVVFANEAQSGFRESFPDAYIPSGFSQGVFRVTREAGAPARVVRDMGSMMRVVRGANGGFLPVDGDALSGMTLDDLVRRVQRAR